MNYIRPQKENKNVQKEHDRRKKKFGQNSKVSTWKILDQWQYELR